MLISRGETAKSAELMKQLTHSVSFLEHGAKNDHRKEVTKVRLEQSGNYLAYIDVLREGLDEKSPEIATLADLEKQVRAIIALLNVPAKK